MILKSLFTHNFRNIVSQGLDLSSRFNVFIGKNAQGKTNLIEAVYLLSRGRSFRVSDLKDLVAWGQASALVEGNIEHVSGGVNILSIKINENTKVFQIDGKPKRQSSDRKLKAVLFSPEEIFLFKSVPSIRRDYLDDLIGGLVADYSATLKNYQRILSQKNRLLADEISPSAIKEGFCLWNERLVDVGSLIVKTRLEWIEKIGREFSREMSSIAPSDGNGEISYLCTFLENDGITDIHYIKEKFSIKLEDRMEDEIIRRISLVGPHRDDFTVHLGGKAIKNYGSQGQMRSSILALKIAEMKLYEDAFEETPLLLLDDVMSELDEERGRYLLKYLSNWKGQVILSTADESLIDENNVGNPSIFRLVDGCVK